MNSQFITGVRRLIQSIKNQLMITEGAADQIQLILENDFTLGGKVFRITIDGKGCDGFTYATGFTNADENDTVITSRETRVHIDPFTAFYLKKGALDYGFDTQGSEDGFIVTNFDQGNFEGKFWKDNEGLEPTF